MEPRDLVAKVVENRMRDRLAILEGFAAEFLKETGFKASECEIVEQHHSDLSTTIFIRKRVDPTVKDLLGFDIPGAHVEWTVNGFNVVRPDQPPAKYAQYVEPPADPVTFIEKENLIARCPSGKQCQRELEWGHPCDRDKDGNYECEVERRYG